MEWKGQHILSTKQFDKQALLEILAEAKEMEKVIALGGSDILSKKIMATIFFEPSTRTRFSFETAMHRLGGRVISNADMMGTSSVKKRETLKDTGKMVSQFADVVVMRHPQAGAVAELASFSDVPVMNAGDGPADHPTQGLLDLYTIWKNKGGFDGLTIGMVGDLKYGRVVHSEADLLKYFGVKMIFVTPKGLEMPRDIVEDLRAAGCDVTEVEDLEAVIGELDVISMTRIQEERFDSVEEYKKYEGAYVLDREMLAKAKSDAIVLHPLPRVDEISTDIDDDPRSKYFEQVRNGVAIRMALLKKVLL